MNILNTHNSFESALRNLHLDGDFRALLDRYGTTGIRKRYSA